MSLWEPVKGRVKDTGEREASAEEGRGWCRYQS